MANLQSIEKSEILILVVDDDTTNVVLLSVILQKLGYNVVTAYNGQEAIEKFNEFRPDMVLMDIMMPVMNGYDATTAIKACEGDEFVPIIFITALTEDKALAKCIDVGGNDFLVKPYNPILIEAKINSFLHLRGIYHSEKEKTDNLKKHGDWLDNEYRISQQVINKILKKESLLNSGVQCKISPKAIFNGDLLMVEKTPDNVTRILIGDFTGHGLSGAIGSIPVAGIFSSMTEKGFSIDILVREINNRLLSVLPSGVFFAAAIIDYNPREKRITIWNGGNPEIVIYSSRTRSVKKLFASENYPFAVVDNDQMSYSVSEVYVEKGDRVLAFTDGVLNTQDTITKSIKDVGILDVISAIDHEDELFEKIIEHLNEENRAGAQIDDITLVELKIDNEISEIEEASNLVEEKNSVDEGVSWRVSYKLEAPVLKKMDPMPMLMQGISELEDVGGHKQAIYLIMRELYANALEHGVLQLDSRIKQQENGFEKFFSEKDRLLSELNTGFVEIEVEFSMVDQNRSVEITIRDSGDGFTFGEMEKSSAGSSYHGRGISMLNNLCGRVLFNEAGNQATAVYTWVSEN
ncbi:MAG: fused response regulator/phosphatase [Gammaproteobacteria bacterium]|nr:fused response regulator/phosphatase [Gammaproteobacteria bacterium]